MFFKSTFRLCSWLLKNSVCVEELSGQMNPTVVNFKPSLSCLKSLESKGFQNINSLVPTNGPQLISSQWENFHSSDFLLMTSKY